MTCIKCLTLVVKVAGFEMFYQYNQCGHPYVCHIPRNISCIWYCFCPWHGKSKHRNLTCLRECFLNILSNLRPWLEFKCVLLCDTEICQRTNMDLVEMCHSHTGEERESIHFLVWGCIKMKSCVLCSIRISKDIKSHTHILFTHTHTPTDTLSHTHTSPRQALWCKIGFVSFRISVRITMNATLFVQINENLCAEMLWRNTTLRMFCCPWT